MLTKNEYHQVSDNEGNNEDRRLVGERLRQLREGRGLTQEALALRVGVTRQTIYRMEQGRDDMKLSRLQHLVRAMDANITELLSDLTSPDSVPVKYHACAVIATG